MRKRKRKSNGSKSHGRRNTGRRSKHRGLSGTAHGIDKGKVKTALTQGGLMLLAAIAAGGAGAAIGKHSLLIGVPVTMAGAYTGNKYLLAAGLGLTVSNGFQKPGQSTATSGVDGFDMKQLAQDAKDRVGTFFENFKEKLYLPAKTVSTTDGLGENDAVKYFVNPYGSKELDLSAMDRIEEQIAAMNQSTNGLHETDREF